MARFLFKFQSILNLKIRLEEQQKIAFATARKALDEEEEKLNNLYLRKEEYEEKGRNLRNESLHVLDILENETAIVRIKEFIVTQTENVKKAEEALEEERAKLEEMMKERKMYEKLREKAFDEFLQEINHEEGVANDERNSFVYGNGQN